MTPASPASGLLEKLGVQLDPELLVLALTHRSFAHENGGIPTNERLEFLGDTVLGLAVTEKLYRDNPELPEGELAKMRSAVVSQKALAEVARRIGLGAYILLGKGELRTHGNEKDSILSDTVEAVIGAVYLTHGLEVARGLVHRLVEPAMRSASRLGAGLDWKTSLQEAAAAAGLGSPEYTSDHTGPDHARVFTSRVLFGGVVYGTGTGTAKKHAEQGAAEDAYNRIAAGRSADTARQCVAASTAASGTPVGDVGDALAQSAAEADA